MFSLKVENTKGETLELTNNEARWQIASIDGLCPPKADINTQEIANWDGSVFNDSRVEERDIELEIYLNKDIETDRNFLYNFFLISKQITLYIQTESKDVSIVGYTEKINIDFFKQHQVVKVDITCPSPYFIARISNKWQLSNTLGGFYFPFAIDKVGIEFTSYEENRKINVINYGEITSGALFVFEFNGDCEDPTIYNADGTYFKIASSYKKGDILELNTVKGSRTLYKTDGAEPENLVKYIDNKSTWLQLSPGINKLGLQATTGVDNIICTIYNSTFYEGL